MPYFERKLWQDTVDPLTDAGTKRARPEVNIAELAQSILNADAGSKHALDGPFRCRKPVRPGDRGVIVLSVSADGKGGPLSLELAAGDLRSRERHIIPSNLVHTEPTHLTIAPGGNGNFEVHVLVPKETKPGLYSGRVIGEGAEPISFVVEYEVSGPIDP